MGNASILFFLWTLAGCAGGGGGYDGLPAKAPMVGGTEVAGETELGGMAECGTKDEAS